MTMTKVEVRCPICTKKGFIEVNHEELKKVERGLMAINVAEQSICEHTFIAYVDKNLNVRDCYIADFQITIPVAEVKTSNIETQKLDNVKLNYTENLITNLLRTVLLKKKAVILTDQLHLANYVHNFFEFITENTFRFEISLKSKKHYKENKKNYKDYIVFDSNTLLRDKDNILDPKKIKEERRMVKKFFEETDLLSSLIILKNEIQKIYEMASVINEYIVKNKITKVNSKTLLEKIGESNIKIKSTQLSFLLDIVENYFGTSFEKLGEASDFLSFL